MLSFPQSSHGRKWTFALDDLTEMRRAANERAVAHVLEGHELEEEAVTPLTPAEELCLVRKFALRDLPHACAGDRGREHALQVPERVRVLALLYFTRVYAVRSMMEYSGGGVLDPRVVMCTAVLIAAKVEEAKELDASFLEATSHVSRQLILALEPDVLAALDYDLCAHSPLTVLDGLLHALMDEARAAPGPTLKLEAGTTESGAQFVAESHERAAAGLRAACVAFIVGPALRADGLLRYSPQQLALAALAACMHTPEGKALHVDAFLEKHLPGLPGGAAELEPVRSAMREAAMAAASVDEQREAKEADGAYHRLKLCHQKAKAARAAKSAVAADAGGVGAKRKLDEAPAAAVGPAPLSGLQHASVEPAPLPKMQRK